MHPRCSRREYASKAIERDLVSLAEREERLVKLYTLGTVQEQILQKQLEEISRERAALNQQLSILQRPVGYNTQLVDQDLLRRVCLGATEWLENADGTEEKMALEALQVSMEATATTATLTVRLRRMERIGRLRLAPG